MLRAVERGHLNLAEPIARYLPRDVASNGATVEEVLGHRSGIPEHVTPRFVAALLAEPSRPWTPAEALSYQEGAPRPRGEYAYSNTNYILLGMAIERITGRSVGTVIRGILLQPLGLHWITYQDTEKPQGPLAVGLTHLAGAAPVALRDGSGLLPCRSVATAAGAAGGMAGDAESMARWAYLLYGGSVLQAESLRALLGIDGQGFGSSTFKLAGEEAIGHPGRIPGYSGAFAYLPSLETSCAVLINTEPAFAVLTQGGPMLWWLSPAHSIALWRMAKLWRSMSAWPNSRATDGTVQPPAASGQGHAASGSSHAYAARGRDMLPCPARECL